MDGVVAKSPASVIIDIYTRTSILDIVSERAYSGVAIWLKYRALHES
jgi:hypothetical protein